MWHGSTVKLHPGTVCHLEAPSREELNNEMVSVVRFEASKGKWQVRLQNPRFRGKELFVPEASLRLAFCVLSESVTKAKRLVEMIEEPKQGACGRGILVAQSIQPGAPLFEEPPLMLTPTGVKRMHEDRWRAYLTLMLSAQRSEADEAALAAFDDLAISDVLNKGAEAAAEAILQSALRSSGGGMSEADKAKQRQRVQDALMRFQSNQFKFDNAHSDPDNRFAASAVFSLTSRLNHSCSPSAIVETGRAPLQPGSLVEGDGVLRARAARRILPGERLTLNYGPSELVSTWGSPSAAPTSSSAAVLSVAAKSACGEEAEEAAEAAARARAAKARAARPRRPRSRAA